MRIVVIEQTTVRSKRLNLFVLLDDVLDQPSRIPIFDRWAGGFSNGRTDATVRQWSRSTHAPQGLISEGPL
jgi:hypothetical protein